MYDHHLIFIIIIIIIIISFIHFYGDGGGGGKEIYIEIEELIDKDNNNGLCFLLWHMWLLLL